MKTLKTILASVVFLLLIGMLNANSDSGVSGIPYNAKLGAVTANSLSVTRAASAVTFASSKAITITNSNGISNQLSLIRTDATGNTLSLFAGDGATSSSLSATTSQININPGTGKCLQLAAQLLEPCSTSSAAANYIFSANAAQAVKSGQIYAFSITNNGTTCATAAGSPALPNGWNLSHPATGRCLFTFPAVSSAASMIPMAMSNGSIAFCAESASSTTTVEIKCFSTAGAASDVAFFVMFQDWN